MTRDEVIANALSMIGRREADAYLGGVAVSQLVLLQTQLERSTTLPVFLQRIIREVVPAGTSSYENWFAPLSFEYGYVGYVSGDTIVEIPRKLNLTGEVFCWDILATEGFSRSRTLFSPALSDDMEIEWKCFCGEPLLTAAYNRAAPLEESNKWFDNAPDLMAYGLAFSLASIFLRNAELASALKMQYDTTKDRMFRETVAYFETLHNKQFIGTEE